MYVLRRFFVGRPVVPMDREKLREKLLQCLGGPWPEAPPLEERVHEVIGYEDYRIERVSYQVEPGDRVPALLLVPEGASAGSPLPAVAVWHQHNEQWHLGKSEPAGLAGDPVHHTGVALVREGYVVLCPDALCFEDRRCEELPGGQYERFLFLRYLLAAKCLAWKNILDMRRAIDYLCTRPEVRSDRIGCYGHSLGSTFTWLLAPWEPRLRCMVGNCCLPTYRAIEEHRLLHSFSNYIPGWMQFGDVAEIVALAAPRPLLLNFGECDRLSPIDEVRSALRQVAQVYRQQGAGENFRWFIEPGVDHTLSPAMWEQVRRWLAKHLKH